LAILGCNLLYNLPGPTTIRKIRRSGMSGNNGGVRKRRGPRGRNFRPEEREIAFRAIRSGASLEEVNRLLHSHQAQRSLTQRSMPQSSYDMVRESYLRRMPTDAELQQMAQKPPTLGELGTGVRR
jgi:hypothetical protein